MISRLIRTEFLRLLCFAMIPVLVFSSLILYIIGRDMADKYISDDYTHMENIQTEMDMLIKELDALNLSFSVNSEITSVFARFFELNDSHALTSLSSICKSYLIPAVVSHEQIHSIYFYTSNPRDITLTSSIGPVQASEFLDTGWMQTYSHMKASHLDYYAETRSFRDYIFENEEKPVITLYRGLYLRNGIIVMNLYKTYFDRLLRDQCTADGQILLCVGEENNILMQSVDALPFSTDDLAALLSSDRGDSSNTIRLNRTDYLVARLPSGNKYNWTYLSLTPMSEVYSFNRRLWGALQYTLLPTLAVCLFVVWRHAKTYRKSVMSMFRLLDAVENHEKQLPQHHEDGNDFYGIIMQRIVRNYAERMQLNYQLEQKERSMHETELQALRSQINPHFLFNTLRSIYWMSFSLSGGQNSVSTMIENMTEILEYSLDSSDDLATLGDEITNTRSYVEIQKMRYENRFEVEWDCEEGVEKYYTIKLLLQPLVENAIMYGMRETGEQLLIRISIRKKADEIHISVSDNGSGISPEELEKINNRLNAHSIDGHMGLYNCNKRLCLTFGEAYCIAVESSTQGTEIRIHFPCLLNADTP